MNELTIVIAVLASLLIVMQTLVLISLNEIDNRLTHIEADIARLNINCKHFVNKS